MDQEPRTTGPQVGAARATAGADTPPDRGPRDPGGGLDRSPEEIRADIKQTREEVGDTVEALAEKTDVKRQAQQRAREIRSGFDRRRQDLTAKARSTTPESAQQGGQQVVTKMRENPAPAALGGAVLAGFLIGRLTGRRS